MIYELINRQTVNSKSYKNLLNVWSQIKSESQENILMLINVVYEYASVDSLNNLYAQPGPQFSSELEHDFET